MKRIYLACPYSDPNKLVRQYRFEMVTAKAASLMQDGYIVFSPISHSHNIAKYMGPKFVCDFDFWMEQDLPYIKYWAQELWVYCLDGWKGSPGVNREVEFAKWMKLPVRYEHP